MKTNTKQVRNAIKLHILECVTNIDGNNFNDLKSACNHLNNEFIANSNHAYNLQKFPNNQNRFSDFLQGLPFNFLYMNFDITNYLNELTENEIRHLITTGDITYNEELLAQFKNSLVICDEIHKFDR